LDNVRYVSKKSSEEEKVVPQSLVTGIVNSIDKQLTGGELSKQVGKFLIREDLGLLIDKVRERNIRP